ncbi:MAG: hypothetical protein MZV49_24775 [Rhodopseudomonas palustris]|nr:hypothetical protein [Rhodopseudomonas palustris]
MLDWNKYHLHPAEHAASRSRTWRAAARSPARSARSGSSGATTASAIRRRWWTRSRSWCEKHQVGFFILADEEPTINRKKFIAVLRGVDRPRPAREGAVGHQHPRHRHSCATRSC